MHLEYNAKIKNYKMATEIFYYRTGKLEQRIFNAGNMARAWKL